MNRRDLERRAADELEAEGYVVERSYLRASFRNGRFFPVPHDIYGGDLLAWKDGRFRIIQVTSTLSAEAGKDPTGVMGTRRRKLSKLPRAPPGVTVEIWMWTKPARKWEKKIYVRSDDGTWPLMEGQTRLGEKGREKGLAMAPLGPA